MILLLAWACGTSDNPQEMLTTPLCSSTIISVFPENGSEDISPTASLSIQLSAPAEVEAHLSMVTEDYVEDIPTTLSWSEENTHLTITPMAPLVPNTPFELSLAVCQEHQTVSFRTTPEPPLTVDLSGATFLADLGSPEVSWLEPAGMGDVLLAFYSTHTLLFQVQKHQDNSLDWIAAAATTDPIAQYPCVQAIDLPPSSFEDNPFFETSTPSTSFAFGDLEVPAYELSFSGKFNSDGSLIGEAELQALVDIQSLIEAYHVDICDVIGCKACPDSETTTCLQLHVFAPELPRIEPVPIEVLSVDDFSACQKSARIRSHAADSNPAGRRVF
jgi:hypothetical protein